MLINIDQQKKVMKKNFIVSENIIFSKDVENSLKQKF